MPACSVGTDIALRDSMNDLLAIMTIDELYPWDPTDLAERVLGTQDSQAPAGPRDGALGAAQRVRSHPSAADSAAL